MLNHKLSADEKPRIIYISTQESRIDFFKNDISAYNKSQKNGWLDEICSHC